MHDGFISGREHVGLHQIRGGKERKVLQELSVCLFHFIWHSCFLSWLILLHQDYLSVFQ